MLGERSIGVVCGRRGRGRNRCAVLQDLNALRENPLEFGEGFLVAAVDLRQLQLTEDFAERGYEVVGL